MSIRLSSLSGVSQLIVSLLSSSVNPLFSQRFRVISSKMNPLAAGELDSSALVCAPVCAVWVTTCNNNVTIMCNLMTQTMSGGEEPQPSVVIQHLALTPACAQLLWMSSYSDHFTNNIRKHILLNWNILSVVIIRNEVLQQVCCLEP